MDKLKNKSIAPALTLMFVAPMLTEVLPGATRFSSIFVFPIEMCVWGGGALLIRYAIRRWQLGWINMLLLAVALAIAEEWLIQQTSLAPMVIKLKGTTYARTFGINYVYFLWAIIYEPVFVVFLSVYLAELIFPSRREEIWVNKTGRIVVIVLFLFGSFLAWFSWTHIARTKVFHLPAFNAPLADVIIAVTVITALIYTALGPLKNKLKTTPVSTVLPSAWLLGIAGFIWAVILYMLVLLGFGIDPAFPPAVAILGGSLLIAVALFFVPRWASAANRGTMHTYGLVFGTVLGSMVIGFLGFIWSGGPDLYFKIITNVIAVGLMVALGSKLNSGLKINDPGV